MIMKKLPLEEPIGGLVKVTFTATESGTAVGLKGCLRFDGSSSAALQAIDDYKP
jgi:hypothetical protein